MKGYGGRGGGGGGEWRAAATDVKMQSGLAS